MNRLRPICFAIQVACLGCAFAMSYWLGAPWPILGAIALLSAGVLGSRAFASEERLAGGGHGLIIVRVASGAAVLATVIWHRQIFIWSAYLATIAWLVATAILLNSVGPLENDARRRWRGWSLGWAFSGMLLWLGAAYLQNSRIAFHLAIILTVTLLILWRRWLRPRALGIQAANTLILVLIGLPIVSFFRAPADALNITPRLEDKPYSYEVARKRPDEFARWTRYIRAQTEAMLHDLLRGGHVRSNVQFTYVQHRIRMNSDGFRGGEIPAEKGDTYRIVALGESTTFGITMLPDDGPWPELLQSLIRGRLHLSRPVEVINAGIPGFTLERNLLRLQRRILPLKPDMIISYHGINEFHVFYSGLPPISGPPPPRYKLRPLKLLADVEYHFRLQAYRNEYSPPKIPVATFISHPMDSQYARDYRKLVNFARTNGIKLVLATYSMAVNGQSSKDLVDFYRLMYPNARWYIRANVAHSQIIKQLIRENPDIGFVDTRPVLDGHHELFYDICHFTPEGKRRMAEIFFAGIKGILQDELSADSSDQHTQRSEAFPNDGVER